MLMRYSSKYRLKNLSNNVNRLSRTHIQKLARQLFDIYLESKQTGTASIARSQVYHFVSWSASSRVCLAWRYLMDFCQ